MKICRLFLLCWLIFFKITSTVQTAIHAFLSHSDFLSLSKLKILQSKYLNQFRSSHHLMAHTMDTIHLTRLI